MCVLLGRLCRITQPVRQYKNSKIIQWVWLKTGLVSAELLAEWNHGGDMASLEEEMKHVQGLLMNLVRTHADETTNERFNVVNFGDEARAEEWRLASESPEEICFYV